MWELSAFINNATGDPLALSACPHVASFHSLTFINCIKSESHILFDGRVARFLDQS